MHIPHIYILSFQMTFWVFLKFLSHRQSENLVEKNIDNFLQKQKNINIYYTYSIFTSSEVDRQLINRKWRVHNRGDHLTIWFTLDHPSSLKYCLLWTSSHDSAFGPPKIPHSKGVLSLPYWSMIFSLSNKCKTLVALFPTILPSNKIPLRLLSNSHLYIHQTL